MNRINKHLLLLTTILSLISCSKSKFLDVKPDERLSIPQSLEDFQAVLDNYIEMNGGPGASPIPSMSMVANDDYYLAPEYIKFLDQSFFNLYTWSDDLNWAKFKDWTLAYRGIYNSNIVLEGIDKIKKDDIDENLFLNVKGSALFYRSHLFYRLAEVFAPTYDKNISSNQLGIPLRLKADIGEKIARSTLEETYSQIFSDLKQAAVLLPTYSAIKTRPSQIATYALLSKIYLSIGQFDSAFKYSNLCIPFLENTLIDFNTLDSTSFSPFKRLNPEIIFDGAINPNTLIAGFIARVDSNLYRSYHESDLRRVCYFNDASILGTAGKYFKGSYLESDYLFGGIAADEVFLIRAETSARLGNTNAAMNDLNNLIRTRWRKENGISKYIDQVASDSQDALTKILVERRKELVFRGTRWSDLRRLNKEGSNITIIRQANGQTYSLKPNDNKYTYLIPSDVISFNPDMPQNPR